MSEANKTAYAKILVIDFDQLAALLNLPVGARVTHATTIHNRIPPELHIIVHGNGGYLTNRYDEIVKVEVDWLLNPFIGCLP